MHSTPSHPNSTITDLWPPCPALLSSLDLLRALPSILLPLPLQELALLLRAQPLQLGVALRLFLLISFDLPLLGLFFLGRAPQLARPVLARRAQPLLHLGAEVRRGDELVWKAYEVREERERGLVGGGGVARGEAQGEREALAGVELVEPAAVSIDLNGTAGRKRGERLAGERTWSASPAAGPTRSDAQTRWAPPSPRPRPAPASAARP